MYKAFSAGQLGFDKTLEESAKVAKKYGYEGLAVELGADALKDPEAVKAVLSENGLKPGGFGLPVEFRGSQTELEAGMERLPDYCRFMQKIENLRCMTWILPASDALEYEENFLLHQTRLTEIAKMLEAYGIRFGLEFVGPPSARRGKKHAFIHDLGGLIDLLDAIGTSNLGIVLDTWHWDLAGQTFEDFKKIPGRDWVVMAHINDAPAGKTLDEQIDSTRALPGATGVLKISDFFQGLTDMNYDGPVYIEPFDASLKEMDFETAVKTATDAFQKVWPKETEA